MIHVYASASAQIKIQQEKMEVLTRLFGSIQDVQTPRALALTLHDLHAELVLHVRSEVVHVDVEIGGIDEAKLPRSARSVADDVVPPVGRSLVPPERRVNPGEHDGARRKNNRLQTDRWDDRSQRLGG